MAQCIKKGGSWYFARTASTGVERTRPVMNIFKYDGRGSRQPRCPGCSYMFKHATHNRDVDLMTVQSVPSPGHVSQSTEEVEMTEHRLTEHSHMLNNGELSVISDTQENLEGIAEHLFSINGDVGLPG